jgi:hypothetical protein
VLVASRTLLTFKYVFASAELPDNAGASFPFSNIPNNVAQQDRLEMTWNGQPIDFLSDLSLLSLSSLVPDPKNGSTWSSDFVLNPFRSVTNVRTNRLGFSGYTRPLSVFAPIQPGVNTLEISVVEVADGLRDSAILIEQESMMTDPNGFNFSVGSWTACSATCLGGVLPVLRFVLLVLHFISPGLDSSRSDASTRCHACVAPGVQSRSFTCMSPRGLKTADSFCENIVRPPTVQACGNVTCG